MGDKLPGAQSSGSAVIDRRYRSETARKPAADRGAQNWVMLVERVVPNALISAFGFLRCFEMSDVGLRPRYELRILNLEIWCILREVSRVSDYSV